MAIIWAILIGFVVGVVAKLLTPGRDPGGFIVTTAIGIAGSLIATFSGRTLGWYQADETAGFLAVLVGAILLLLVYRMIKRR